MRPRSRTRSCRRPASGFTLVEILVAIVGLAIVLVAAGQLVFATRRSTQREQYQVEARQTARAATEYADYLLRGATDFNFYNNNAGAIVVWLNGSGTCPGSNGCIQATYDNITSTQAAAGIGDEGTDLISFGKPSNPQYLSPTNWPGFQTASNDHWGLPSPPCPTDDTAAQNYFCTMVQMSGPGCSGMSPPLLLVDDTGNWTYYQITSVRGCAEKGCCGTLSTQGVHVVANHGLSLGLNPPGGHPDMYKPQLVAGAQFAALRVCNRWLEQKDTLFDPSQDSGTGPGSCTNPSHVVQNGGSWSQLLPNIEDFQLAYLFRDGTIWNNTVGGNLFQCLNGAMSNVPCQSGCINLSCPSANQDIANVIGLRVTITARSSQQMSLEAPMFLRPPAENNPGATAPDLYYRFQASALAMLRNRTAME